MSCCHHRSPCAPFTHPVNPDQGQCFPLPEVRDCEAPVLPDISCREAFIAGGASVVYDPNHLPAFHIVTHLFDVNCDIISDDISGDPILTLAD